VIGKARATIIALLEFKLLHHGAHRAIEHQNPAVECMNDIERFNFSDGITHLRPEPKTLAPSPGRRNKDI
jgi:hypothetical protein